MGQQQALLIKVVDAKNNPVGFANIFILNKIDSTKITKTITDSIGITKINLAPKNAYIISVSAIGYKKYSKDYFINLDSKYILLKIATIENKTCKRMMTVKTKHTKRYSMI